MYYFSGLVETIKVLIKNYFIVLPISKSLSFGKTFIVKTVSAAGLFSVIQNFSNGGLTSRNMKLQTINFFPEDVHSLGEKNSYQLLHCLN